MVLVQVLPAQLSTQPYRESREQDAVDCAAPIDHLVDL